MTQTAILANTIYVQSGFTLLSGSSYYKTFEIDEYIGPSVGAPTDPHEYVWMYVKMENKTANQMFFFSPNWKFQDINY